MEYSLSFRLKSYMIFAFDKLVGIYNLKLRIRTKTAESIYKSVNGDSYKSDDADTIIWMYYPNERIKKVSYASDVLLMAQVAACKEKFKIHDGMDIGIYHNKKILFNLVLGKANFYEFDNYSSVYQLITQQLENQGNKLYPSYNEALYWENKVFMYTKFKELNIHTPRTEFYTDFQALIRNERNYPFLIKVPHSSGSFGLFNVTDEQFLKNLATDSIIVANQYYIVQERLNITMDMRVICVGDQIEHFYWRKNNDKTKWRSTSTSFGSSVDFETFPEQWRQYILDTFKKLNMITGAFDVGWQNDDTTTEPYFFEVSPSYDINPKTQNKEHLDNYGKYKKQLLFKNSYDQLFMEQTYTIKGKGVKLFFDKVNAGK